jgi:hypothetical protein
MIKIKINIQNTFQSNWVLHEEKKKNDKETHASTLAEHETYSWGHDNF